SAEPARPAAPTAEQLAFSLLAKPSTERVPFAGSGGGLLLAVGSGGRAALVVRGLEPAAPGWSYHAWVVSADERPAYAGAFSGRERASFLNAPVPAGASVVVGLAPEGRTPSRPVQPALVATRSLP
ncbi:MAG TPA: hypothetical protein VNJ53_12815, partial [Gaiellaceae bacterium]|nr:hypothetical protein [Gaiellaceae bacterium]